MLNGMKNITVLFLVMEFPPVNTTGNFRSLKFVKYLRMFGIEPVVVTFMEEEAASFFNASIDRKLLDELPGDTTIYRIHCDDGRKYHSTHLRSFLTIFFSIKDNLAKRWRKYLFGELDAIVARHRPQLVFTSLPPFSSGMLAAEIARKYDLRLVVDMRDLWALFGHAPLASRIHYHLMLNEERKIFSQAAAVIAVTPQMIKSMQRVHPRIDKSKFHFIPNGFDKEPELERTFVFKSDKSKIVIGYVGSFYFEPKKRDDVFKPWWRKKGHKMFEYSPVKQDWLYRSPYFFLKTIDYLIARYPELRARIQIEFIGKKPEWLDGMLKEFNLQENFLHHGFVSSQKALLLQQRFDLFLSTAEKVAGDQHYCLPSKVFDYVGQNKPILAFVTPGIQQEFMINSGLGVICDPDDIEESSMKLYKLISDGKLFAPNYEYIQSFKRSVLAEKLAEILQKITGQ